MRCPVGMEEANDACKHGLTSDALLAHYIVNRELRLACDPSRCGLGAVISKGMDDGQERPIAYIFETLSSSESNYAQLNHKAFAILFWGKKIH